MKDTFRTPRTNFGSSPMLFLAPWSISGFPFTLSLMMMRSLKPKNLSRSCTPQKCVLFFLHSDIQVIVFSFIRNIVFHPIVSMETMVECFSSESQLLPWIPSNKICRYLLKYSWVWPGPDERSLPPHRDRGIVDQFGPVDLMIISRCFLLLLLCFQSPRCPGKPSGVLFWWTDCSHDDSFFLRACPSGSFK